MGKPVFAVLQGNKRRKSVACATDFFVLRLFAEQLDFFHIGSNDSGDGLRICCLPGGKVQTALGDMLADFQKHEGDIFGEQCACFFS